MAETFSAIVAEEQNGKAMATLRQIGLADIADGDVLVDVAAVPELAGDILAGKVRGCLVADVNA